jgi:alanine racemase
MTARRSGRPAQARIDLQALRHNYGVARAVHGGRVLAVLKADAYGHGAAACARALADQADGYAVAFLDEAVALREAGIDAPILVLEGPFDADEVRAAAAHDLWLVVHRQAQIGWIRELDTGPGWGAARPAGLQVWLKVDSGMHRAGFSGAEAPAAYDALRACGKVARITLMTHFARADEPHADATAVQVREFDAATRDLPGPRSLCNSAGLLAWPQARRDWGRAGIMLYGDDPCNAGADLRPVMTLASEVFAVRELPAGAALGYGGRHVTQRPTRVGLVATGYADGYPRGAPDGTPVAIDGVPGRLIGRVSMDMLTVDLTAHPGAGIGSTVELWGRQVAVAAVAAAANTISYELLCNVKRVARVYE